MWVNFSILLIFIYNARLQHINYLNYYSLYFIMLQPLAILQCFNQRISFSQLSVVCLCLMNLKFYQITSRFGIKQQLTHSPVVFLPHLTDDYLLLRSYLCLSFPFYQNILRSYFLYAFIFLIRWSLLGVLFLDCGMETVFLRMNQIANELKIAMIKYLLYIIQNPMMVFSTLFFKFIQKYQRFIGILIQKQRQSFQKYYYLHESILLSLFSSDYILVNFSLYQILVHVILSKKHKDILQKMARANGYIIAKQFQKEGDNFQVSMDISPDNSTLVFGYGPMIKLVTINTSVNFWFSDKKIFGKSPIYCKDQKQKLYIPNNQRVVRDVKWNCCDLGKNLIGVVMGQAAFVYDVQDPQNSKVPEGFLKVFQNDDVMRQGDYSSKFIWYPNSKDVFLCTSSKSDEIISRDLRQSGVVSRFNGTEDLKTDQKVQDLKFNPVDSNIFAIISKSSTIQIFDYRKPTKSIIKSESVVQNYKTNLLDWKKDGKRLVSAFGGLVKLWSFNGSQLTQQYSFEHKNAISDFKWLKKKYTDYLLVSEMQENIIYGYKINQGKHDIQILVDPRHSGLKKFMTDKQEQLILGLTNFQDSKKHQHEMIAVFLDYQSSHNIWQRTKFKKPNHLGLDNQLLFSATNYLYKKERPVDSTFTLVYKQVESSAQKIKLQILDLQQKQSIQEKRLQMEKRLAVKQAHKKMREQRTELKRQIKQRFLMENSRIMLNQKQSIKSEEKKTTSVGRNTKVKKSSSIEQRSQKSISKNQRINDKVSISKKSEDSFSESSSQNNLTFIQKDKWILSYCEEVQFLDQNYKIQINDQIPEQKGEVICKHNSKIAQSIGKNRCAQFWKYIYEIAFSENEEKYNLSGLYQDKIKVQVSFKDNKVVASCENKSQMMKKTIKYSLQKMLQNLVDENQLQTAVMACVMIRNKDEKLLSLQFIEPFLVCYKQLLKAMGLTFISTNLSYIAKLNQAVESPLFRFDIPIGCGQCYKKFNESKCTCLQVCIICGQSLISRLVVGCKICGHMAHAVQYEQLINKGIKKCPYDKCQHECFKKV